jgi:hypothetical protein
MGAHRLREAAAMPKTLCCLLLLSLSVRAEEKKADDLGNPIFNGKDLDGWVAEGATEYSEDGKKVPIWTVGDDGLLRCAGHGYGFLRYAKQEYADFSFHVEYRMTKSTPICNSGIGIRTVPYDKNKDRETRSSIYSYEMQLLDDAGKKADKHGSGSLYRYVAQKENAVKPAGEWNTVDIECRGPNIKITINGKTVIDLDQTNIDPAKWDVDKGALDELKKKPLKGYLCLQVHGGKLDFRNVRVKELRADK